MTSPPREISVTCPNCRTPFTAWYRPSINLSLGEEWTQEQIAEATSVRCPACKRRWSVGALVIGKDGYFHDTRE